MRDSKDPDTPLPEVPDDGPSDPAARRRHTLWMLILCLITILVTIALLVNRIENP